MQLYLVQHEVLDVKHWHCAIRTWCWWSLYSRRKNILRTWSGRGSNQDPVDNFYETILEHMVKSCINENILYERQIAFDSICDETLLGGLWLKHGLARSTEDMHTAVTEHIRVTYPIWPMVVSLKSSLSGAVLVPVRVRTLLAIVVEMSPSRPPKSLLCSMLWILGYLIHRSNKGKGLLQFL